jgi:hypothetical protein
MARSKKKLLKKSSLSYKLVEFESEVDLEYVSKNPIADYFCAYTMVLFDLTKDLELAIEDKDPVAVASAFKLLNIIRRKGEVFKNELGVEYGLLPDKDVLESKLSSLKDLVEKLGGEVKVIKLNEGESVADALKKVIGEKNIEESEKEEDNNDDVEF